MKKLFEHRWGGEDMWYQKAERWAKEQKFPIDHIALAIIAWLKEQWIDARIEQEMKSVDKQAQEIVKQWEEEDKNPFTNPEIIVTPSEVEGLDTIEIKSPWSRE
jgi:mannitol-1-phosphate/altronate dehydrogenase